MYNQSLHLRGQTVDVTARWAEALALGVPGCRGVVPRADGTCPRVFRTSERGGSWRLWVV